MLYCKANKVCCRRNQHHALQPIESCTTWEWLLVSTCYQHLLDPHQNPWNVMWISLGLDWSYWALVSEAGKVKLAFVSNRTVGTLENFGFRFVFGQRWVWVGVGMLRGAGDPLLEQKLDLDIHQDSTIVNLCFWGKLGRSRLFLTDAKFKIIQQKINSFSNTCLF